MDDPEAAGSVEYYTKLHPEMPNATGFIAILSPDLKLKSLRRLPRGAGAITSAVVADGSVYLGGVASESIANFQAGPGDQNKYQVSNPNGARRPSWPVTPDRQGELLVEQKGWSMFLN